MHEYDVFNDNAYQELKATVEQNKAIVSVEKQLAKRKKPIKNLPTKNWHFP